MNHTIPWTKDEYLLVDGLHVVYTLKREKSELSVKMPGGAVTTISELRAKGRTVVMPKTLRRDFEKSEDERIRKEAAKLLRELVGR